LHFFHSFTPNPDKKKIMVDGEKLFIGSGHTSHKANIEMTIDIYIIGKNSRISMRVYKFNEDFPSFVTQNAAQKQQAAFCAERTVG